MLLKFKFIIHAYEDKTKYKIVTTITQMPSQAVRYLLRNEELRGLN